jgi:membrane-associated phospholipid phosphatase
LALLGLLALGYPVLNVPRQSLHQLNIFLDGRIPFVPVFSVAYLSYFGLIGLTLAAFLTTRAARFKLLTIAFSVDLIVSYFFFFFYQTHVIRPSISTRGIFSDLVATVYRHDNAYNAFPSLHTSISFLCALLWRYGRLKFSPLVFVWALLIISSTVLIKQHYVLDLLGGLAVATASYYVAIQLEGGTASAPVLGETNE